MRLIFLVEWQTLQVFIQQVAVWEIKRELAIWYFKQLDHLRQASLHLVTRFLLVTRGTYLAKSQNLLHNFNWDPFNLRLLINPHFPFALRTYLLFRSFFIPYDIVRTFFRVWDTIILRSLIFLCQRIIKCLSLLLKMGKSEANMIQDILVCLKGFCNWILENRKICLLLWMKAISVSID